MQKWIIACVLLCTSLALYALPASLAGSEEGWMDLGINYTMTNPFGSHMGHNSGLHFYGIDQADWGLGLSLLLGENLVELTFNFIYHFQSEALTALNFPVVIRVGWMNSGFGVIGEMGVKYFLIEWIGQDDNNLYLTLEGMGGLHLLLYNLLPAQLTGEKAPHLIPALSANLGLSFPPPGRDYYYIH